MRIPACFLAVAVVSALAAAQQFRSAPERRVPASVEGGHAVVTADVDGDGDVDFCVVKQGQDRLYLNDGHGSFTDVTATALPPASANWSYDAAFGDVDGDRDVDLVVVGFGANGILQNDGTGRFVDSGRRLGPPFTISVALRDLDGDGDLDAVLGNPQVEVQIWINDGAGNFRDDTASRLPGLWSTVVHAADVDGDSDADLLFQRSETAAPNLFLNDGVGRFAAAPAMLPPVGAPLSIATGDLDGDGDLDLLFGGRGDDRLFLQEAGAFVDRTAALLPQHGKSTEDLEPVDVDEDGDLDVWLGIDDFLFPEQNRLYLNDGSGRMTDATAVRLPVLLDLTRGIAAADLDGDGDPDLLASETRSMTPGRTHVLINGHRQLDSFDAPTRARRYELVFRARPGYARTFKVALGAVGLRRARLPLPPFGMWYLDPAVSIDLPPLYVPPGSGELRWSFPIPDSPQVVGIELGSQAAILDPEGVDRLTAPLSERVRG